jgi:tRNA threonylcarbamoyl adenosine modification protein YeaZ
MLTLAFECSNLQLAIAILRDQKLIDQEIIASGFSHSELLVAKIDEILKKNKLDYNDLDLVVVGNGPASFTALRVALTVAKIIKISCQKIVITVDKCEVLANYALNQVETIKNIKNNFFINVVVNVLANDFFIATFELKNQQLNYFSKPCLVDIETILKSHNNAQNIFIFEQKELAEKFSEIPSNQIAILNNDAHILGIVGLQKFQNNNYQDVIEPIYLMDPKISIRKK